MRARIVCGSGDELQWEALVYPDTPLTTGAVVRVHGHGYALVTSVGSAFSRAGDPEGQLVICAPLVFPTTRKEPA